MTRADYATGRAVQQGGSFEIQRSTRCVGVARAICAELRFSSGRAIDRHRQPKKGAPHWLLWHMQPATQGVANGNAVMQFPAAQNELESH